MSSERKIEPSFLFALTRTETEEKKIEVATLVTVQDKRRGRSNSLPANHKTERKRFSSLNKLQDFLEALKDKQHKRTHSEQEIELSSNTEKRTRDASTSTRQRLPRGRRKSVRKQRKVLEGREELPDEGLFTIAESPLATDEEKEIMSLEELCIEEIFGNLREGGEGPETKQEEKDHFTALQTKEHSTEDENRPNTPESTENAGTGESPLEEANEAGSTEKELSLNRRPHHNKFPTMAEKDTYATDKENETILLTTPLQKLCVGENAVNMRRGAKTKQEGKDRFTALQTKERRTQHKNRSNKPESKEYPRRTTVKKLSGIRTRSKQIRAQLQRSQLLERRATHAAQVIEVCDKAAARKRRRSFDQTAMHERQWKTKAERALENAEKARKRRQEFVEANIRKERKITEKMQARIEEIRRNRKNNLKMSRAVAEEISAYTKRGMSSDHGNFLESDFKSNNCPEVGCMKIVWSRALMKQLVGDICPSSERYFAELRPRDLCSTCDSFSKCHSCENKGKQGEHGKAG